MWWWVKRQVGECLVTLWPFAEEPHRALREVDRLTRNPEKLANAGGMCWKDTLGRKGSFRTHQPPSPTRRGLVTAWQETKKLSQDEIWTDNVREKLKVKKSKTKRSWKRPKTKKKSGRSLVRVSSSAISMEEKKRRRHIYCCWLLGTFVMFHVNLYIYHFWTLFSRHVMLHPLNSCNALIHWSKKIN